MKVHSVMFLLDEKGGGGGGNHVNITTYIKTRVRYFQFSVVSLLGRV